MGQCRRQVWLYDGFSEINTYCRARYDNLTFKEKIKNV